MTSLIPDGKISAPSALTSCASMSNPANKAPSGSAPANAVDPDVRSDEMHDNQDDLGHYDRLPLVFCGKITRQYEPNDQSAITNRESHKSYAKVAATCGAAAVLAAIGELSLKNFGESGVVYKTIGWLLIFGEAAALYALLHVVKKEKKR